MCKSCPSNVRPGTPCLACGMFADLPVKQPHKHAATIKAWADGADIECRIDGDSGWRSARLPYWSLDVDYRVKPEEKPLSLVAKEAWFAANKTVCLTHSEVWQTCADAVVKAYKERTGS